MALSYDLLALAIGTLIAISLTPYSWRLLGRLCGAQIKSKTSQRRQLLLEEGAWQQDAGANGPFIQGSDRLLPPIL
jgi:hypothetical protein